MTTTTLTGYVGARMVSNFATTNFDMASLAANLGWIGERNDVSTQNNRWLIKFAGLSDLTFPRNAVFDAATMYLYVNGDYSNNTDDLSIYPCLRNWVASEATWNRWASGSNWTTAGCGSAGNDYEDLSIGRQRFTASETVGAWKTITMTASELQKYANGSRTNYGFLVKFLTNTDNAYRFACGISSESNLPYIVITWHMPSYAPVTDFSFALA